MRAEVRHHFCRRSSQIRISDPIAGLALGPPGGLCPVPPAFGSSKIHHFGEVSGQPHGEGRGCGSPEGTALGLLLITGCPVAGLAK